MILAISNKAWFTKAGLFIKHAIFFFILCSNVVAVENAGDKEHEVLSSRLSNENKLKEGTLNVQLLVYTNVALKEFISSHNAETLNEYGVNVSLEGEYCKVVIYPEDKRVLGGIYEYMVDLKTLKIINRQIYK